MTHLHDPSCVNEYHVHGVFDAVHSGEEILAIQGHRRAALREESHNNNAGAA